MNHLCAAGGPPVNAWDTLTRPLHVTATDGRTADLAPGTEFGAHRRPGDQAGMVRIATFTRQGERVWMEFWSVHEHDLRAAATNPDLAIHTPKAGSLRLAIVGSRSLDGNPDALRLIRHVLDSYRAWHPDLVVISGGAVGVDRMAAAEARRRGLQVIEHLPAGTTWRHYRARNLRIARDCDELVRIADPRSRTYGSGWARDRARELGRPTTEYTVTSRPEAASGRAAGLLRGNDA